MHDHSAEMCGKYLGYLKIGSVIVGNFRGPTSGRLGKKMIFQKKNKAHKSFNIWTKIFFFNFLVREIKNPWSEAQFGHKMRFLQRGRKKGLFCHNFRILNGNLTPTDANWIFLNFTPFLPPAIGRLDSSKSDFSARKLKNVFFQTFQYEVHEVNLGKNVLKQICRESKIIQIAMSETSKRSIVQKL